MSLIIPDVGEVLLLSKMLKVALSVDEDYTLKLYKSYIALPSNIVAADLDAIEANFTNYTSKTLTRSGWGTAATVNGTSSIAYGTPQSWTCGVTGNTIYGYYVVGATSGILLWAQAFFYPRIMKNGTPPLIITPSYSIFACDSNAGSSSSSSSSGGYPSSGTIVTPYSGEVALLDKMLKTALSVDEGYTLKLFKSDVTLYDITVAADLDAVEADFTNYTSKSLTRAGWGSAATVAGRGLSTYGTTQSWTCGASGNTVYGYYLIGATSGTLLWAEKFSSSHVLANGDILNLTPAFAFGSCTASSSSTSETAQSSAVVETSSSSSATVEVSSSSSSSSSATVEVSSSSSSSSSSSAGGETASSSAGIETASSSAGIETASSSAGGETASSSAGIETASSSAAGQASSSAGSSSAYNPPIDEMNVGPGGVIIEGTNVVSNPKLAITPMNVTPGDVIIEGTNVISNPKLAITRMNVTPGDVIIEGTTVVISEVP